MLVVFVRAALRFALSLPIALFFGTASAGPLDPGSKLCFSPLEIPIDVEEGDERRFKVEEKLIQALRGISISVPNPQEVEDLVERVKIESGGFIDPFTGRLDEARYRGYHDQLALALREELGCDGQLFAQVVLVYANYGGGIASWDGTKTEVTSSGRIFMGMIGGAYEYGWIRALSLWLRVTDLNGDDLAFRSAGIETLVSFAIIRDKDFLPEDRWLTDDSKVNAAIKSALGRHGSGLRTQTATLGARIAGEGR